MTIISCVLESLFDNLNISSVIWISRPELLEVFKYVFVQNFCNFEFVCRPSSRKREMMRPNHGMQTFEGLDAITFRRAVQITTIYDFVTMDSFEQLLKLFRGKFGTINELHNDGKHLVGFCRTNRCHGHDERRHTHKLPQRIRLVKQTV
jgi:hypothetical protein